MHKVTIARAQCVAIAAALMSGCAGLTKPLVTEDLFVACPSTGRHSTRSDVSLCEAVKTCEAKLGTTHCYAFALADRYREQYLQAASNRANLAASSNLVAVGAGLTGLFYALDGRSKYQDRVRRLGTIGVGAYAANAVFSSSPLTQTYLNGAAAMECAVFVLAPNIVPPRLESEIDSAIENLATAIASFRGAIPSLAADPASKDLELLVGAEQTYAALIRRRQDIKNSELRATMRVHQIASEVNRQIVTGQPDPNSVFSLVQALPGRAESIGIKPRNTAAMQEQSPPINGKGLTLAEARNALQTAWISASSVLESIAVPEQDHELLAKCSPDPVVSKFEVSPSDRSVLIKQGESYTLRITDAGGIPFVGVSGAGSQAIKLSTLGAEPNNVYVLEIKGEAPTGVDGPRVTIRSHNGWRVVEVRVTVSNPK